MDSVQVVVVLVGAVKAVDDRKHPRKSHTIIIIIRPNRIVLDFIIIIDLDDGKDTYGCRPSNVVASYFGYS